MKQLFFIHNIHSTISNRRFFLAFPLLIARLCFIVTLLSSCEETDRVLTGESRMPAVFTPLIEDEVSAGTSTRVTGNTWEAGDQVGIYMMKDKVDLKASNLATNVAYKTSVIGTNTSLVPANADETIYYPGDGSKVNFTAYYPYKSGTTTSYYINVATQNPQSAIDLLYCQNTTAYSQHNAAASLTFTHKLSKVIVNVTRGSSLGTTNISALTSAIKGTPNTGYLNLTNGVTTNVNTYVDAISFLKTASAADKVVFEAILIPHSTGYANRAITFTLGSTTYTYPTTQTFESGKKYTYNLILTSSGVALQEISIGDWGTGTANWDGKYALTTSSGNAVFSNWGSTKTITIKTTASTTPAITNSASSWLTASLGDATSSGGWYTRTLTLTASENTSTNSRSGTVTFTVEGLNAQIAVSQTAFSVLAASTDGMSNCYIVSPGATITFPVTRAYTGGVLDSDYNGTFSVSRQWSSGSIVIPSVSGSGRNAYITVQAPSTKGNALITLKQGGSVVWSYHIWVTDMDLTKTWTPNYGSTASKRTFMDRNLGATENTLSVASRGLFYQWGRKDPFPQTDDVTGFTKAAGGQVTIATTIKNPGAFNPCDPSPYDWNSYPNNNLWNNTSGTKTIYDPCPAGWRVPPNGPGTTTPWYGITASTGTWTPGGSTSPAGYIWGTSAWPAAGYRGNSYGALNYLGSYGFYWSATANGTVAYMMHTLSGGVFPNSVSNRAFGFPVRCVAE